MNPTRRSFLTILAGAPIAALVTPGKSHAELLAEERAANPLLVASVPRNTPEAVRAAIAKQIEAVGHTALVIEDSITLHTTRSPTHEDAALIKQALLRQWNTEGRMP